MASPKTAFNSDTLLKDIQIQKSLPQNPEAETAVLGSMMIDKDAIASAIQTLEPTSFYSNANQEIFSTIVTLYDKNKVVDVLSMVEEKRRLYSGTSSLLLP